MYLSKKIGCNTQYCNVLLRQITLPLGRSDLSRVKKISVIIKCNIVITVTEGNRMIKSITVDLGSKEHKQEGIRSPCFIEII